MYDKYYVDFQLLYYGPIMINDELLSLTVKAFEILLHGFYESRFTISLTEIVHAPAGLIF